MPRRRPLYKLLDGTDLDKFIRDPRLTPEKFNQIDPESQERLIDAGYVPVDNEEDEIEPTSNLTDSLGSLLPRFEQGVNPPSAVGMPNEEQYVRLNAQNEGKYGEHRISERPPIKNWSDSLPENIQRPGFLGLPSPSVAALDLIEGAKGAGSEMFHRGMDVVRRSAGVGFGEPTSTLGNILGERRLDDPLVRRSMRVPQSTAGTIGKWGATAVPLALAVRAGGMNAIPALVASHGIGKLGKNAARGIADFAGAEEDQAKAIGTLGEFVSGSWLPGAAYPKVKPRLEGKFTSKATQEGVAANNALIEEYKTLGIDAILGDFDNLTKWNFLRKKIAEGSVSGSKVLKAGENKQLKQLLEAIEKNIPANKIQEPGPLPPSIYDSINKNVEDLFASDDLATVKALVKATLGKNKRGEVRALQPEGQSSLRAVSSATESMGRQRQAVKKTLKDRYTAMEAEADARKEKFNVGEAIKYTDEATGKVVELQEVIELGTPVNITAIKAQRDKLRKFNSFYKILPEHEILPKLSESSGFVPFTDLLNLARELRSSSQGKLNMRAQRQASELADEFRAIAHATFGEKHGKDALKALKQQDAQYAQYKGLESSFDKLNKMEPHAVTQNLISDSHIKFIDELEGLTADGEPHLLKNAYIIELSNAIMELKPAAFKKRWSGQTQLNSRMLTEAEIKGVEKIIASRAVKPKSLPGDKKIIDRGHENDLAQWAALLPDFPAAVFQSRFNGLLGKMDEIPSAKDVSSIVSFWKEIPNSSKHLIFKDDKEHLNNMTKLMEIMNRHTSNPAIMQTYFQKLKEARSPTAWLGLGTAAGVGLSSIATPLGIGAMAGLAALQGWGKHFANQTNSKEGIKQLIKGLSMPDNLSASKYAETVIQQMEDEFESLPKF